VAVDSAALHEEALATATEDKGGCQLSGSLLPDIALGGTNAAQRTNKGGARLKIFRGSFSGGCHDPANLDGEGT
jgi:hypothetical protein